MASRRTSSPKPSKDVDTPKRTIKPRYPKEIIKDLRTGIQDLQAIDPEHPWARLLKEVIAAIRDDHSNAFAAIKCVQEAFIAGLMEITRESREGMSQVRGELEQIRSHLARFIDQGIRERHRDERIEEQLAGINERLKERSRVDRNAVLRHGKMMTAEELSGQLDATERAKDEQIATLRGEIDRLRSDLEAARATATKLESMALNPIDRRPMPSPRKSWRTTAAESVAVDPFN